MHLEPFQGLGDPPFEAANRGGICKLYEAAFHRGIADSRHHVCPASWQTSVHAPAIASNTDSASHSQEGQGWRPLQQTNIFLKLIMRGLAAKFLLLQILWATPAHLAFLWALPLYGFKSREILYPWMMEVTKGLQASASGFEKTGAGPMAMHRMAPSSLGELSMFSRMSNATIAATEPARMYFPFSRLSNAY